MCASASSFFASVQMRRRAPRSSLGASTGSLTTLYRPEGPHFAGDLDLHFDGDRLLFSSIGPRHRWHVFELRTDGTGLRQVTPTLPDVDHYDACYLPDGAILFTSTASMASRAAVLVAGLLENYYTCAETLFLRLSQFFENHIETVRWHKDLLEKMTLEIESVRPRLLSDETYVDLRELMRFRHLKRYYFGTAYDWTRLDELLLRMNRVHPMLVRDVVAFKAFLRHLDS